MGEILEKKAKAYVQTPPPNSYTVAAESRRGPVPLGPCRCHIIGQLRGASVRRQSRGSACATCLSWADASSV